MSMGSSRNKKIWESSSLNLIQNEVFPPFFLLHMNSWSTFTKEKWCWTSRESVESVERWIILNSRSIEGSTMKRKMTDSPMDAMNAMDEAFEASIPSPELEAVADVVKPEREGRKNWFSDVSTVMRFARKLEKSGSAIPTLSFLPWKNKWRHNAIQCCTVPRCPVFGSW